MEDGIALRAQRWLHNIESTAVCSFDCQCIRCMLRNDTARLVAQERAAKLTANKSKKQQSQRASAGELMPSNIGKSGMDNTTSSCACSSENPMAEGSAQELSEDGGHSENPIAGSKSQLRICGQSSPVLPGTSMADEGKTQQLIEDGGHSEILVATDNTQNLREDGGHSENPMPEGNSQGLIEVLSENGINECAICMDRPAGVVLRPCGHDHFCRECAMKLFSCPLCRSPLLMQNGVAQFAEEPPSPEQVAEEEQVVAASRAVLSQTESCALHGIGLGVWLFIFLFGFVEYVHDLRSSCVGGDPLPGSGKSWLAVTEHNSSRACFKCLHNGENEGKNVTHKNLTRACDVCAPGYYNLGTQCFKYLENLPAMKAGAALGGTTYFTLIVTTQTLGIVSEITLIRRLLRKRLMPRKEFMILLGALAIEISRMFLVDIFVMQDYFGGRAYKIFREPVLCNSTSTLSWQGADSQWYCDDLTPHRNHTNYYVADRQQAWSRERYTCSTFTTSSPLLNFDEQGFDDMPGHTRFKTLGWVIGGEFALYYFFATFINEVADNMFVVPTTTKNGWVFKIFSVALEVFQLGALCPAAIFTHKECLYFTDPLGVSLHSISNIVIVFGYLIWGFVFLSLPLAIIGGGLLGVLIGIFLAASALAPCLRACGACCCCCRRCSGTKRNLDLMVDRLGNLSTTMKSWIKYAQLHIGKGFGSVAQFTMLLAFLPMLIGGIFLGVLVVVGQASKEGSMQMLTAVILFSDVLFKIIATLVTEIADFMLHRRVTNIVLSGANRRTPGQGVGQSIATVAWPEALSCD